MPLEQAESKWLCDAAITIEMQHIEGPKSLLSQERRINRRPTDTVVPAKDQG